MADFVKEVKSLMCFWSCGYQAAQRMNTPAKYIVGTSTIPFNPSAFGEVNIKDQFENSVFIFGEQTSSILYLCLVVFSADHLLPEDVFSLQRRGHARVHAPGRHAGRRAGHRPLRPNAAVL